MAYIKPRGDRFYYIKVWDISTLRDHKLSKLLDEDIINPFYFNGEFRKLSYSDKIYLTNFWKTNIVEKTFNRLVNKYKEYKFEIDSISRDEFINSIPESLKIKDKWDLNLYSRNISLRNKELLYKEKLDKNVRHSIT